MRLRTKIGIVLSGLLIAFLYGRCARKSLPGLGAKLPVTDKEQILLDPVRHTITVITASGHKTSTLPDRVSTIDIRKDGSIVVTAKQFGFEQRPFFGGSFSDIGRFIAGSDMFYWKKLDLGAGLGVNKDINDLRFFVKVSYNVYSNLQLGVTYDHRQQFGACITVRI